MSDDLLQRATSALRETTTEPAHDLERARERARLLARTRKQGGLRPQTLWQWAAVLLLGFFVSTAMAHVIAVQAPRLWRALRSEAPSTGQPRIRGRGKTHEPQTVAGPSVLQPSAAPDASANATAEPAELPAPAVTTAPSAAPGPALGTPVASPAQSIPLPKLQPRRTRPAAAQPGHDAGARSLPRDTRPALPPSAADGPAPEPAGSAELALFRAAQALHLAHDPRAIDAWDAYLRAAKHGALVPEAQYNRALALLRAGRHSEARGALLPFAQGAYAGFRQREASALLARLPQ